MGKKNLIIIVAFTLLSLLWCCWPLLVSTCEAAEVTPLERQNYISIPMQQWERLKSNTKMLDANLMLLADSLTAQEQRSNELMTLLTEARNELTKTQTALQTASASLRSAENSLQTANELCVKLRKQIESEREAAVEEREKAYCKGWLNGFCCGLAGGVLSMTIK